MMIKKTKKVIIFFSVFFLIFLLFYFCKSFCKNEMEDLSLLGEKVYNSNINFADREIQTEKYIGVLEEYMKNNGSIDSIRNNIGISTISNTLGDCSFNLVCYDANLAGFGSLERTWTLLQIVNGKKIEVYRLFEKSAEYPTFIMNYELSKEKIMIVVAGVTNMSRSNTTFLSFWEFDQNGLEPFDNIILDSEITDTTLFDNEIIIEHYNDDNVQIKCSDVEHNMIQLMGNSFNMRVLIKDEINIVLDSMRVKK